ncbi:MAG TPA: 23S rRNA (guanosine(2251)-2'-O)-methyltransferase RlmB [Burkholderiales bacterium]
MVSERFIYGFHALTARLRRDASAVREIYFDAVRHDPRMRALLDLARSKGVRAIEADPARLAGIARGGRHQGVAARVEAGPRAADLEEVLEGLQEPVLLLVLDGVQDPHNLGACLRTADAFGVHALIAPRDRAAGISATVEKVASGAAETVPFFAVTNLARTLRELKERGIWTVGAAADSEKDLYATRLAGPLAWVLGAEGEGLRRLTRETCDELVAIPMHGSVESVNVSVAAGICLFETRRQRVAAPDLGKSKLLD